MKKIIVCMVTILVAFSVTGCFDKTSTDSKQTNSDTLSQGENSVDDNVVVDDSSEGNAVSDDPIENAQNVVNQYMKYANLEFNESMLKLMTPTMQKQYTEDMENQAHDHAYDENEENMLTDVNFVADTENSKELESINIPEDYIRAFELVGEVKYKNKGEESSDYGYAIVIEASENNWQIAFIGTKSQAYLKGIIVDEQSQNADINAKAVYEATEKAYKTVKKKKYKFEYVNYICTENDEFVNEIKKNLSDELKDTYFTIFLTDGKLDYVLWSQENDSEVMAKYPE